MRITEFLVKHEKLYFLASVVWLGRKKSFREKVNMINEDPRQVVIENRGNLHRG